MILNSKNVMEKIFIFVVICTFIMSNRKVSATTAECDYGFQNYNDSGTWSFELISYYSCVLKTEQSTFSIKLTTIDGQHTNGYDDNDVKYLVNNINANLKTFSSIFCDKFRNLNAILMGDAGIESIDADAFTNCGNLIFLRMFRNRIKYLPDHVFRPLEKLQHLIFYNNMLQSINPECFGPLPNLSWMRLTGNQISEIPPKAFASLGSLKYLHFYGNGIKKLYPDSFEGLNSMKTIMLHVNEISDLPVGVLAPLKNLEEFAIRNNKLTTIHSDSFGIHPQLEAFYFGSNQISSFDKRIIDKTNISEIYFKNNLCYNGNIFTRDEIITDLKQCFDNYKPRNQPPQQDKSNQNTAVQCGKSMSGLGNVIGGKYANRGDYPW